jgi:hypothetical protein
LPTSLPVSTAVVVMSPVPTSSSRADCSNLCIICVWNMVIFYYVGFHPQEAIITLACRSFTLPFRKAPEATKITGCPRIKSVLAEAVMRGRPIGPALECPCRGSGITYCDMFSHERNRVTTYVFV